MSWIYESSPLWRRLVHTTRESAVNMAAFVVITGVGSAYLGQFVMNLTNPHGAESPHLRAMLDNAPLDQQVAVRVKRERLQVLLDDARRATEEKDNSSLTTRWRAALLGREHGTAGPGTTLGKTAIDK
ncbi:hypothetical protein PPROV_000855600 [Pycnococcus provasolii]|uniref:Uncharacterized protein n=1 Tax=Pycnococcus provasolii TaxID=41880 RepID=A0A830HWH3_9CHLO|nr:hypothetical protein PPROV_000855600 [Pycnococcus provasolii]|mmetsp:Transcript_10343/g.23391  ORF Transcript_10343/g.23391 Transcript_10343/m.23391 type:complete len:128 (-) Transcript_10343:48-431(-)